MLFVTGAQADENASVIETGYLYTEPGDVGDLIGAEVTSVDSEGQEETFVQVLVPVGPEKVDRIEIYDLSGNKIPQMSQPDLLRDYPDDRVGVKLHMKKKPGFEFRLRLIDIPDTPSAYKE